MKYSFTHLHFLVPLPNFFPTSFPKIFSDAVIIAQSKCRYILSRLIKISNHQKTQYLSEDLLRMLLRLHIVNDLFNNPVFINHKGHTMDAVKSASHEFLFAPNVKCLYD